MLRVFLTGIAMGAADVVPGVSGGTIAFISGVYFRLINAIRAINPTALRILFQDGVAAAWRHIDGFFLLTLGLGIAISILSLARLITWLLEYYPVCVWGFFFGLILASSIYLARQLRWGVVPAVMLLLGIGAALVVAHIRPGEIEATPLAIFLSGAVAICAMILPGISGSFILLIVGMYPRVLKAISEFDLAFIALFALGCGAGLLGFSHVLGFLFTRFKDAVLGLLTGFLAGSLWMVWPWQQAVSTYIKDDGEVVTLEKHNVLPHQFQQATGQEPYTMWVIGLFVLAVILVLGLARVSPQQEIPQNKNI